MNTCMSVYLRVYIGVCVHVHVVTSLDRRRLHFILRLTYHSESSTYTTKPLQCAFLAIAATLIALLSMVAVVVVVVVVGGRG